MQICKTRNKRSSPPSRTALMPSLSVQNPPERWEHNNHREKIFYHRGRIVTDGGVMVGSPSEREPRKQDQRGWCTQKAAATRVIAQKSTVWKRLRRADSASVPHMRGGALPLHVQ
ncbi:hypothetical protein BDV27DRAFT_122390 [Aspergillus caelatus]|uniref:Uncharacterized protein n=1 Tax=Aspergillus caelatus TaxID=61420 RepID=A0A5N7AFP7_9EURO|nr:uncharacterized protein BDV27DRAFT_122390 [Aspergillus caelatus]KAE8368493.1 hypothetical protein BDV27DRAFT_122390 [Aspergillus caelatus]